MAERFQAVQLSLEWVVIDVHDQGRQVWPGKYECSLSKRSARKVAAWFNEQGGVRPVKATDGP